jgi:hypothetical protein
MTLIKKADVNNYLAARRRKTVFPFKPVSQPDATGYSGGEPRDLNPNVPALGSSVDTSTTKKPQS